jgi:hypothetical protein
MDPEIWPRLNKGAIGMLCVMPERAKMNRDQLFDSIELRGGYEYMQF